MSEVVVRELRAGYGTTEILHGVSLAVAEGATTAILGDSGSGKTTLLRAIAGFLRPTAGEISVAGRVVAGPRTWVASERRGVGYVRQEGALFPHLSVAGNVAFGLPRHGLRGRDRAHRDRVMELLELVELPADLADRYPAQLSGGQQQRVALARALAPRPSVVLLDEPFSSLDTALRHATREATARALRAAGATVVLVTHDQGEALSFADEVAVLRGGHVRQVAAPRIIYGEPIDPQVAAFMGDAVMVRGEGVGPEVRSGLGTLSVVGFVPRGPVDVLLRPEQIRLTAPEQGAVTGVVTTVRFFGHDAVVDLDVAGDAQGWAGGPLSVRARVHGNETPVLGARVGLRVVGPVRVFKH
ncbi:sugar ABC transporter [Tessaracoccus lapidicaptus]|uniref:ABC-type quaternary amine transporter n=1 Tax=Tessaracoccus lapidicaptus TaxID=1427523 RepID=A0A1C0AIL9_9ACTN|nr:MULTISPECIES: ABC transporter ATP-binding protein [Tessaracoccus]AQX15680.1 ABC transporter ATP-binding protein [Tessaracoccus sp. T2.5-30]OCL31962.1 sugar ABC transporter [Tessaracoccus lapidicaptus]VEP40066.1 Fe(3+) ions import ATP-binding protein FbpC 2 [Tessaracoccus lapidicaptus]